jgi:cytochrome c peroxidase
MKKIILFIYIFTSVTLAYADNDNQFLSDELAPGWKKELGYKLPEPGSYKLYNIRKAGNGQVVDEKGNSIDLYSAMNNKITLLSFIYSNCSDKNGCPLATAVFYKIQEKLKKEKHLLKNLKMISLSFDPEYDTPSIMSLYGKDLSYIDADWRFLTTSSLNYLTPILQSYDQPVIRKYKKDGSYDGVQSHILRVYLIDDKKLIRNIYNVDFLHPDLLINDIKTLLLGNE